MLVPTVLAMVVCDAVWRDPDTRKVTLLGTFTQVFARDLPVEMGQVCVYFELSAHRGTTTVRADLRRAGDDDDTASLVSAEMAITFDHPLEALSAAITLYNVDLPTDGEYYVQLSVGDDMLAERRFFVASTNGTEDA